MLNTKEVSLRLGLTERTIRNYCSNGRLKCEKRRKGWLIDESSLDNVIEVKIIGKDETEGKKGKEREPFRSLDLPPYSVLSERIGYLKAKVEIYEGQIKELKATINLLQEQLTYQKTSWIRKLFKR